MLLQYQNFKMCETYKLLTSNCIKAYSIESYAFTVAICETSEKNDFSRCATCERGHRYSIGAGTGTPCRRVVLVRVRLVGAWYWYGNILVRQTVRGAGAGASSWCVKQCGVQVRVLRGQRLIRAHGFDSSAHTHVISPCASSARTLVDSSAHTHHRGGSSAHTGPFPNVAAYSKFHPCIAHVKG